MAKKKTPNSANQAVKVGDFLFVDDQMALSALETYDVPYAVESVNLGHIDLEGSIKRNNRLDRQYNEGRADDLALQLLDSGTCLRIVGRWMLPGDPDNPNKNRTFDILGGNHRTGALGKLEAKQLQAYVVDTDDPHVLTRLRNNLNNTTGEGNTRAVRLANAYTEYKSRNLDPDTKDCIEELAASHHLKVADLRLYLDAQDARQVIEGHGYRTANLTPSHLKQLRRLKDNSTVLAEAGRVANRAGLTVSEVREMVTAINKERRGEEWKLAKVKEFEEQYKTRTTVTKEPKKPVSKPTFRMLVEHLKRPLNFLARIDPTLPEHVDNTTAAQNEELQKLFLELSAYMGKVIKSKEQKPHGRKRRRR